MITTIQIHTDVKMQLDKLKKNRNLSYEDVILELITYSEKEKRKQHNLLVEGYRKWAGESKNITKEWSETEEDWGA